MRTASRSKRTLRAVAKATALAAMLSSFLTSTVRGEDLAGEEHDLAAAARVLDQAFENLYGYDLTMVLRLELHRDSGPVSVRATEVARKKIRGLTHSFGHFLSPKWMRGTRMLLIDNANRSDDVFLFLPEQERIKRLNSVQRSDHFLGSDFWYEDLERRRVSDYRLKAIATEGEPEVYFVIDAAPLDESSPYATIRFTVRASDRLIKDTSFYRASSSDPFREIEFDLDSVIERDGHLIPTRLTVRNHTRGTWTVATFEQLKVNPALDDSLFRETALLTGRRVPGLTDD